MRLADSAVVCSSFLPSEFTGNTGQLLSSGNDCLTLPPNHVRQSSNLVNCVQFSTQIGRGMSASAAETHVFGLVLWVLYCWKRTNQRDFRWTSMSPSLKGFEAFGIQLVLSPRSSSTHPRLFTLPLVWFVLMKTSSLTRSTISQRSIALSIRSGQTNKQTDLHPSCEMSFGVVIWIL